MASHGKDGRWVSGVTAVVLALGAAGCGTTAVTVSPERRMAPAEAVAIVDRCARLNALTAAPETSPDERQTWADDEGWYAVEEGRIVKLFYADVEGVTRTYARQEDVGASICLLGLMGPFSSAGVEVTMKNGTVWRLETDPGGDPAVCLNCLPLWVATLPRPLRKTRRIGEALESLRLRHAESAPADQPPPP